jgi:4-amino-4-deoxy-L-arabinose transferase-like glycosyltransferase
VALFAIALATAGRLAYLVFDCPLALAPDEAHYWDWSRHLDWSYYSKGPLVAWLIRASCWLCGADSMLAVRLPAVLCGGLTLLGLFTLTWRVYRRPGLALAAVGIALTLPVFAAGGLLMTIDAPFVCCWTWALVVAHGVLFSPHHPAARRLHWVLLGLLLGVGILAKYTMVLFVPSLGLYLAWGGKRQKAAGNWQDPDELDCSHTRGRLMFPPGFWVACTIAAACCLPILIWNVQHDWVTFKHVGGQAGVTQAGSSSWLGPLEYLGGQAAVLLGFWFAAWVAALGSVLRGPRTTEPERFLFCLAAPMVLVFFAFSFKTKVQLNWPVAGYLAGLPLLVRWLADGWHAAASWRRATLRAGTVVTVLAGSFLTLVMHHTEWLYPAPALDAPPSTVSTVRKWDPTCRLRGWPDLAAAVGVVREEMRRQGIEPVLAASPWNLPGEIAFYLPDRPTVYCLGVVAGSRHNQYDLWRPNPVADPERFLGRTFVYVGDLTPGVTAGFDRIDPPRPATAIVAGQPVATWFITVAHGFKGFPLKSDGKTY